MYKRTWFEILYRDRAPKKCISMTLDKQYYDTMMFTTESVTTKDWTAVL